MGKEKFIFFYGKLATLGWHPDLWQWIDGGHFLDYTTKDGHDSSLIRTRALLARWTNGRATFRATIGSIDRKYGTPTDPVKKPRLCGQFGTKPLSLMNGELLLHRHQSPSNVCFVFLILVSRSNANFGIAFKPGEHGDGPRSSCTNFVGFAHAIMLASIGSKFCLGKEFPKSMAK